MISKLDSKKNFLIYLFLTISSIITPLVVSRQFTSIHDLAYFITNSLRIYNGQTIVAALGVVWEGLEVGSNRVLTGF